MTTFRMLFSLAAIFCLNSIVIAEEWRYSLFSNVRYSDNLNQTINEIEGYAINTGITFNLNNEPDAEFSYATSGLLGFTSFSQDGISDEYFKGFNGNFLYQPKEFNFKFLAVENISQVPQNRFVTQEINNLRDVEVSAVKPTYFINLSNVDRLNLDYSLIVVNAEDTDVNVNALNGSRQINEYSINYVREINSTNALAIFARKSETDFEGQIDVQNQTAIDFEQEDVFLRWTLTGQSNLLRFDFGKSKVTTELDEEIDVDFLQFLFRRQINRTHSISLTHRKGFDSIFNLELGTNNINVNNRSGDFGNTLRINENRISYDIEDDFITTAFSYFKQDLNSVLSTNTESGEGFDFSTVYRLSRLLEAPFDTNVTFAYFQSKNQFDSTLTLVTENEVNRASLSFNYYLDNNTFVFVRLQKRNSESFAPGNPTINIDSNTIFFGFSYSPNGKVEI